MGGYYDNPYEKEHDKRCDTANSEGETQCICSDLKYDDWLDQGDEEFSRRKDEGEL